MTRIGNEGVDLPNARVIIIASGLGGSETENPQRFGRALRDVTDDSDPRYLYEVYTETKQADALNINNERKAIESREKFLRERGYTPEEKSFEEKQKDIDFGVMMSTPPNGIIDLDGNESFHIMENVCVYVRVDRIYSDAYQIKCEYIAKQLGRVFIELRHKYDKYHVYDKHRVKALKYEEELRRTFPELVI